MPSDSTFPIQDPATYAGADPAAARTRLAGHVATLGRGPGKSRALTRDEARDAMGIVLHGLGDPHQIGALLMLLRYRGEDAQEIAGLVEAARGAVGAAPTARVALDWPSYGAGRTRGAPWFLLAALALGQSGTPILMHGSNAFSSGIPVATALAALGLEAAGSREAAAASITRTGFAYLPLATLSPELDRLLDLRRLLGLRSPVNTVARLLNPFDATAAIDGVFHPPYIALHLGVAQAMGYRSLTVVKGAGGEAERNPAKRLEAHRWQEGAGPTALDFPVLELPEAGSETVPTDPAGLVAVWRGETVSARALSTVIGTIALGLLAAGGAGDAQTADAQAHAVWASRRI